MSKGNFAIQAFWFLICKDYFPNDILSYWQGSLQKIRLASGTYESLKKKFLDMKKEEFQRAINKHLGIVNLDKQNYGEILGDFIYERQNKDDREGRDDVMERDDKSRSKSNENLNKNLNPNLNQIS